MASWWHKGSLGLQMCLATRVRCGTYIQVVIWGLFLATNVPAPERSPVHGEAFLFGSFQLGLQEKNKGPKSRVPQIRLAVSPASAPAGASGAMGALACPSRAHSWRTKGQTRSRGAEAAPVPSALSTDEGVFWKIPKHTPLGLRFPF